MAITGDTGATAVGPYVLSIDIGSTATRAGLYDSTGAPLKRSKVRVEHEFLAPEPGASEIDPDQVVDEVCDVIEQTVDYAQLHGVHIDAVAMDTIASSIILVDDRIRPLTPCITYADNRCFPYADDLATRIDESDLHNRTGVRLHTSYHPARWHWLNMTNPEAVAKTHMILTLGEYIYFKLAGITGTTTSMASWSGVLNVHTGKLDDTVVPLRLLQEPIDEPVYPTSTPWPALNGIAWFRPIPDGWASSVGSGAVDTGTVALAAGTSGAMRMMLDKPPAQARPGLWCYRVADDQWIHGGALNDVGRAFTWMRHTLAPVSRAALDEELAALPSGGHPSVLPFFTGERATGWARNASASMTSITARTTPLDIWRGVAESIALSYRRIADELSIPIALVAASGGVNQEFPAWLHMLADALQVPVTPVTMKRTTLSGNAKIALRTLDPGGERLVPECGEPVAPRAEAAAYYDEASAQFQRLYDSLI